jgi:uncharacterized protein (DUF1810 family)
MASGRFSIGSPNCEAAWSEAVAMTDPIDLQRFLDAQAPVYPQVLRRVAQRSEAEPLDVVHLPAACRPRAQRDGPAVCYRFPRWSGRAYLGHGVLGSRLRECTALVNAVEGRTIREILGSPDDLKFHSSMTLFGAVSSDPEFAEAITKFYAGKPDQMTLDLLGG